MSPLHSISSRMLLPSPLLRHPPVFNMCLQRRVRPAHCSCEFSNFVAQSQSDPKLDAKTHRFTCGTVSVDNREDYEITAVAVPGAPPGLPHTMEQLLPQVAREVPGAGVGGNTLKVVTLVAVTFGYADMLMSFVCRLRQLQLADNLVVAALDEQLYKFAFTQGLAVYYEQVPQACSPLLQILVCAHGQCQEMSYVNVPIRCFHCC